MYPRARPLPLTFLRRGSHGNSDGGSPLVVLYMPMIGTSNDHLIAFHTANALIGLMASAKIDSAGAQIGSDDSSAVAEAFVFLFLAAGAEGGFFGAAEGAHFVVVGVFAAVGAAAEGDAEHAGVEAVEEGFEAGDAGADYADGGDALR